MKKKQINKPKLKPDTTLIDTHCHLDMEAFANEVEKVVKNAAADGVDGVITIGIDLASSCKAIELAKKFPRVWASVGIHPHSAAEGNAETYRQLRFLAGDRSNKVVGFGEIGLDFAKNYCPRDIQVAAFATQLAMAKDLRLPVIIHDRDAHDAIMDIIKTNAPFPASGVMHCFSGDIDLARKVIELGLYISIPGIVTFTKSDSLQQVAREIPLESMILETDAPFLSPVPFRGKINRPSHLLYTAQKIAELRGISLEDVARQTTRNAQSLFHLYPEPGTAVA